MRAMAEWPSATEAMRIVDSWLLCIELGVKETVWSEIGQSIHNWILAWGSGTTGDSLTQVLIRICNRRRLGYQKHTVERGLTDFLKSCVLSLFK